jgi:hypothetical protein
MRGNRPSLSSFIAASLVEFGEAKIGPAIAGRSLERTLELLLRLEINPVERIVFIAEGHFRTCPLFVSQELA